MEPPPSVPLCQVQEVSRSLLLPSALRGLLEAERHSPHPQARSKTLFLSGLWVGGTGKGGAIWEGPSCEQTAELAGPSLCNRCQSSLADLHGGSDGVAMGTAAVLGAVLV